MNKHFKSALIDDNADVTQSGEALAPKRRRGRPLGAVAAVTQQPISADDIAFLRSVVQGVSPQVAAKLYLSHLGKISERSGAEQYHQRLRKRIEAAAFAWPELAIQVETLWRAKSGSVTAGEAEIKAKAKDEAGSVHSTSAADEAAERQISLEAFAEQFPEDMYSENELLELYLEAYPEVVPTPTSRVKDSARKASKASATDVPANAAASSRLSEQLAALAWMDRRLAVRPSQGDEVLQWIDFSANQYAVLKVQEVVTLGQLRAWMVDAGARWWDAIPRYGRLRGRRLNSWLDHHGIQASASASDSSSVVKSSKSAKQGRAARAISGKSVDVPFEHLVWPSALRGARGPFRSGEPNTLAAADDVQAIHAWFATLGAKTPATQKAYRRAIERLALWAVTERGMAISAMTTSELEAFFAFLKNPPAHWVQSKLRTRAAEDWRPLKGPLNDASVQLTTAAVRSLFAAWHANGYLRINPAAVSLGGPKRQVKLDVMRSFTGQDKAIIRQTLEEMEDGPRKRRLVALIRLLQTSGLRRNECASVTWRHLERVRIDGVESDEWVLRWVGKGGRERAIPLPASAVSALEMHREDRLALIQSGHLSVYADVPHEDMPLIGILDERLAQHFAESPGAMPHNARREMNESGRLSSGRLYGLLKDFFRQCAKRAGALNSDFLAASTHWLRHTYAHDSLAASDNDIGLVQQLLGHADVNTTARYVKSDLASRVRVMRRIENIV
ncbi:tyrosine-type recombinase/integrase [Diaphorobacter caeni]|uniref:tyrosine-type recombinase/integrase n=1 Tax=Diaphorobacter caeni TaxID=2784387 RepID=UPI00188E3704|nr:tyrosine-type recombinase/integrase [Diaphorobacter caeni]MBF5007290.1 tyrosine-type recombinase/integrase [Diaphorobacter caeni]